MRRVLRVLASTTVWILVAVGCLGIFPSPVLRYATGEEHWWWLVWGISVVALVLSAVVIKLRQMMQ